MSYSHAAHTAAKPEPRAIREDYITIYDFYRPSPPDAILDQAVAYCGKDLPDVVADVGSGTGLSTMAWRGKALDVFGIEPNTDMRDFAESKLSPADLNIHFLAGYGHHIPLPDNSVDIVTCSQSFHWMEAESTLAEINRVLRKGGVLVVFDAVWPPSYHPALERAYHMLFRKLDALASAFDSVAGVEWMKEKHQKTICESGYFGFVREAFFHKREPGSAERFEGIALSHRGLQALLHKGFDERSLGIDEFRAQVFSQGPLPEEMTFHYKAIYAIK